MKDFKLNLISKIITENKLDAFIITSKENRMWFSQFYSSAGIILVTKNTIYLLLDGRYYSNAILNRKKLTNVDSIIYFKGYKETLNKILVNNDISTVGFEADKVTFYEADIFNSINQNTSFRPINTIKLREIKSISEVNNIKKAVAITDKVFQFVKTNCKIGMTEMKLASKINEKFAEYGSTELAFDTIVASGINSAYPHHRPSNKKIQEGDLLVIDIGCKINGYCSDMTRTFFIKNVDPEKKKIYDIVKGAQEYTIKNVVLNDSFNRVDSFARNYIADKGYDKYFIHRTGHGMGIEVHEEPNVVNFNIKDTIKKGMVFTIEPGIYIEGLGGVRIEDDIYIDEKGDVNVLGTFPKDIQIING